MAFSQTAFLSLKSSEDARRVPQPPWCDAEHGPGTLPSFTDARRAAIPQIETFSQVALELLLTVRRLGFGFF